MGKITRLYHCCAAEDDTLQIEITEEGLLKFFLEGAGYSSDQYVSLDKE